MAWTTEELIRVFRLTIPAMSGVSDEELSSDIEIYRYYVSERRFGRLFPKALAYFIAHMRTLNDMIASAVASGSGAGDAVLNAGSLTSEKEGDLSRGYSAGGSGSGSGGSNSDDILKKTLYGKLFLQLRDMVIVSATVRVGGGGCGCGSRHRPWL